MKVGETVTVTLQSGVHYNIPEKPLFNEGDKIKLAKHLWEHTQRTKNRRVVFRMLKKEYCPHTHIKKVKTDEENFEITLTINPFKF